MAHVIYGLREVLALEIVLDISPTRVYRIQGNIPE